jgi:hypothetical protein
VIISDDSELVRGNIVPSPNDEIAKVPPSGETLRPKVQVFERDLLSIWNAKTPVHSRRSFKTPRIGSAAAFPRINRFVIQIIRSACRLRQLLPRTAARINESAIAKEFPRRQMDFPPFTLRVRRMRPAAVRPFVPANAQPAQVFVHRGNKFWTASIGIEVFVPKHENAVRLLRPIRRNQKSTRMSEMEKARWRWRDPSAIYGRHV